MLTSISNSARFRDLLIVTAGSAELFATNKTLIKGSGAIATDFGSFDMNWRDSKLWDQYLKIE
jgi:hypothetical protein